MDPHSWSLHWDVLLAIGVLAAGYFWSQRRWPADATRKVAFDLAVILLLVVYVTPLHTIALHYLLSVHLLQNVVTAEWAPGLVVFALAPALARELERSAAVRFVTHPLVALPIWLGVYYAWHVPWAYDAALRHQWTILHLEHATYFFAGCLLWWPVVHGERSSGAKAGYLFAAFVLGSPLGLLLALLPHAVYGFYLDVPRLWGLSPLVDQQIAGVTMASEQSVVLFAAFAFYLLRFFDEESSADTYRAPTVRRGSPRSP